MSCHTKEALEQMLEDVVNELELCEAAIQKHGPLGTPPAELVRLVLAEKDKKIQMLRAGMVDVSSLLVRNENCVIRTDITPHPADMAKPSELRCAILPTGALKCNACGEMFPMPGGEVKWVCAVMDAFTKAHRNCRKKD